MRGNAYQRWTMPEQIGLALELMRQGRLRTEHLISHRLPADEAVPVWDALTDRQAEYLGVLLQWS